MKRKGWRRIRACGERRKGKAVPFFIFYFFPPLVFRDLSLLMRESKETLRVPPPLRHLLVFYYVLL